MKKKLFTEDRKVDKTELHTCQNYGRLDRRKLKKAEDCFDGYKEMTEEEFYRKDG